jgi:YesN/AraC family two-component response regulator
MDLPCEKYNILIVDDSQVFINSFTRLIRDAVSDCIENISYAHSGEEGLLKLNEEIFDYVFVDIDMPGIDGLNMTKLFNMDNYRQKTKVIAVSFHNEFEYLKQMLEAGASKYLVKDQIDYDTIIKIFK